MAVACLRLFPGICLKGLRNPLKSSVRIAVAPSETRTRPLPNTLTVQLSCSIGCLHGLLWDGGSAWLQNTFQLFYHTLRPYISELLLMIRVRSQFIFHIFSSCSFVMTTRQSLELRTMDGKIPERVLHGLRSRDSSVDIATGYTAMPLFPVRKIISFPPQRPDYSRD